MKTLTLLSAVDLTDLKVVTLAVEEIIGGWRVALLEGTKTTTRDFSDQDDAMSYATGKVAAFMQQGYKLVLESLGGTA